MIHGLLFEMFWRITHKIGIDHVVHIIFGVDHQCNEHWWSIPLAGSQLSGGRTVMIEHYRKYMVNYYGKLIY